MSSGLGKGGRKITDNKLTAIMQVRNEAGRYLEAALADLSGFADEIVIVDDGSTDDTPELAASFEKVVKLVRNKDSLFHKEWLLREQLWRAAEETSPDWLLAVDADEFYEDDAKAAMRQLINQDDYDTVSFRMYDFWDSVTHYREDDWWNLHQRPMMTLVRYLPGFHYAYPKRAHHATRLPFTYNALPSLDTDLRIKHYGWAGSAEDRRAKYDRYMKLDPQGHWGNLGHYASILDPNPRLIRWQERERRDG
ncbi:glycosyltransferase [Paenibacillus sp. JDR-2]|uniref:glycosyltransferase n=1 Tax=Paenibacillus sp. (strain JDR-2) TaxID=324057 RepID=UPI0001667C23|nr:glycosyltransferase [Paenibacillus sp. JDR-2]ACT04475.1 glycosyl transferase family 2 [Paenibacillus sp. JDR-2]